MWLFSAAIVFFWRLCTGGISALKREVLGFVADLTGPVRALLAAYHQTWQQAYEDFGLALSVFTNALVAYGPFSQLMKTILYAPIVKAYQLNQEMSKMDFGASWQFFGFVLMATLLLCHILNLATSFCFHRYFAHRSWKSTRFCSFVFSLLGTIGLQRGALFWASIHRLHHKECETKSDPHSPSQHGLFYAHCGWIIDREYFAWRAELARDWLREAPELVLVEVFGQAFGLFAVDTTLNYFATTAYAKRVIAFAIPLGRALSFHAAFFTNSLCHDWHVQSPSRAQELTRTAMEIRGYDTSTERWSSDCWVPCAGKDKFAVALLNAGEGCHGNHHMYPRLAKHGPHWLVDSTYCAVVAMESLGLIWDVQRPDVISKRKTT